jgi:L-aminoadipate-semialdehyde dehydrogenase
MCSGLAHDPLQRDIFTPLFVGAPIVIPTDETLTKAGSLARWMQQHRISVSCLTPAMGQVLTFGFTSDADFSDCVLDKLRLVFFVGDLLIKRDVARLMRLAPNVHCINMYGSTETQRAVAFLELRSADELALMKEVIPVGRGMKDVDLLLLNKAGNLAGIGELAEIFVRSPHLAAGYLDLPVETHSRFIRNPFRREPSDRMYKSGDLGRYTVSGAVECSGRVDDQIKLRGFRIELAEISAVLSKQRFVDRSVTLLQ